MDVTPATRPRARLAPWAALVAALSGEGAHQQVLSDLLRFDCRLGSGPLFLLAGVAVLAWMALGVAVSLAATRDGAATPRFIARLGVLAALLMAVAVAWQTFAGFVVPACPG